MASDSNEKHDSSFPIRLANPEAIQASKASMSDKASAPSITTQSPAPTLATSTATETPTELRKPWTAEDYLKTDTIVRECLKAEIEETPVPEDGASVGTTQIYKKVAELVNYANTHESSIVRLNIETLISGLAQTMWGIDEPKTKQKGPDDVDVDIEAARLAKFRLIDHLQKEMATLSTKDVENFLVFMELVHSGMTDGLYNIRRETGFIEKKSDMAEYWEEQFRVKDEQILKWKQREKKSLKKEVLKAVEKALQKRDKSGAGA